ncbi:MAG: thioredoxin family protein [Candidatus Helarchaeota archaeon]|nr:thioredoxin family protein [Candidatus Helarchaeota archaeon]
MPEKESKKVRIEFFESPTCPHCPVASRMLRNAKKIYKDDIEIIDINITTKNGQMLAQLNNVTGTPTIFMNGELKFQGEPQKESDIFNEIEKNLDEEAINRAKINRRKYQQRINMIYS